MRRHAVYFHTPSSRPHPTWPLRHLPINSRRPPFALHSRSCRSQLAATLERLPLPNTNTRSVPSILLLRLPALLVEPPTPPDSEPDLSMLAAPEHETRGSVIEKASARAQPLCSSCRHRPRDGLGGLQPEICSLARVTAASLLIICTRDIDGYTNQVTRAASKQEHAQELHHEAPILQERCNSMADNGHRDPRPCLTTMVRTMTVGPHCNFVVVTTTSYYQNGRPSAIEKVFWFSFPLSGLSGRTTVTRCTGNAILQRICMPAQASSSGTCDRRTTCKPLCYTKVL